MSNGDLFYICGIALAVSAVVVSFIGLRVKGFPGKAGAARRALVRRPRRRHATFAVLHAQDEERQRRRSSTEANEEARRGGACSRSRARRARRRRRQSPKSRAAGGRAARFSSPPRQPISSSTRPSLTSKPGKVTIDFDNPAALEHNVAIEQDGKEIAATETITEGKTSVSADLAPGNYIFLCTVPGHAEAGMEGTLVAAQVAPQPHLGVLTLGSHEERVASATTSPRSAAR